MADKNGLIRSKLGKVKDQLPYLPRTLGIVWTAARAWIILWAVLLVVQGLLPVALVYLTRALVDQIAAALNNSRSPIDWSPILVLVGAFAAVVLLGEVLSSVASWVRSAQSELVQDHISALVHDQSIAVDLAFYEFPDYYDRLHRARSDASYRPMALVEGIGSVVQNAITLAAMAVVLVPYGPWLPVALLISTLPAFFVVLHYSLRRRAWQLKTTADQRRTWYYDWLITSRDSAAEMRLFELGQHFESEYQKLRARLRGERLQLERDQTLAQLGAGSAALSVTGITMALMVGSALRGQVTLGDLALFYQAFNQGQSLMRSLLRNVGEIYQNVLFLGNLFEFLALEPRVVSPSRHVTAPATLTSGIRFREVSFRYPGSERVALENLDLAIPAGKIAAIVGPNGAGKTTLTKLLCRLYDPDAGRIELDGIDLRDLRLSDVRRMMAVLPQEYVRYSASVADNIALGDLGVQPTPADVRAAAARAAAHELISRLPQGYDSLLGKWFEGGTELSVGEWQRIAMARTLLRRAQIIVLDEPTSAMDPWTEAEWLKTLRQAMAEPSPLITQTVILITHRLTTAQCADIIYVMHRGRIVESGNHADLVGAGGLYSQLWTTHEPVAPDMFVLEHSPLSSVGGASPQVSERERIRK